MTKYVLSLIEKNKICKEIIWNNKNSINSYLLMEIDNFTNKFEDEETLKEELIKKGIIELKDHDKKVCIVYKYNGEIRKLLYGPAFSDSKTFLSESNTIFYLKKHSKDLILLERLCNHYRNSYVQGTNTSAIRDYINKVRKNMAYDFEENLNIDEILRDFVIREIYTYDSAECKYKMDSKGSPIIKYRQLHELGMFLSHYNKEIFIKQEKKPIVIEPMKSLEEEKHNKVKVKKNFDIPGQMSLFN